MGTIVAFENVSLDGVTQDPTAEEGFATSDWRDALTASDVAAWGKLITDDALGAQALLLGRRSYEYFAGRYPSRTGPLADQMNTLPKYVVSTKLTEPGWNAKVIAGDVVAEVSALRDTFDGEIRVYGSTRLLRTLFAHDLVDEVRLAIFPVVMGGGERLFGQTGNQRDLRMVEGHRVGDALVQLTYAVR
jgi:dihydrofolate reductase